jgi:hypothetical protein
MIGLCLSVASVLVATLPTERFTLAWTHSVEKIRWEEDYAINAGRLELTAARVHGSGAGMEIPEGARYRDGAWEYRPRTEPLARLRLAHSGAAGDYTLCWAQGCQTLAKLAARDVREAVMVELFPCALNYRGDAADK